MNIFYKHSPLEKPTNSNTSMYQAMYGYELQDV